jgi:medium-chain acyl-[acyl-carrier-protein] hydrolase
MLPLVELIAQGIDSFLDKPFAFFGHSMGATISFELARLLRRRGASEPLHLFVSGRTAPQSPEVDAVTYNLPDDKFVEVLRRLNGTPKEALDNLELMQVILPLLRADFEAIQTYTYEVEPPLRCHITAFGGLQDPDVSPADLEAWREQTTAQFSLNLFPGDHFFLNTHPQRLLRAVVQEMNRIGLLQARL